MQLAAREGISVSDYVKNSLEAKLRAQEKRNKLKDIEEDQE